MAPHDFAGTLEMISVNDERKFVWDSDDAFYFDHCAEVRDILDDACDAAGTVEGDPSAFEGALALA